MSCERGISAFQSRQGKSVAKSHNSGIMILSYLGRTGCEPCRSEILVRLPPTAARLKLIFLNEKSKLNLSVIIAFFDIIIRLEGVIWKIILTERQTNIM